MAIRVIDDTKLNDIAVAIQTKDSGGQMTVDEMPTRIEALPSLLLKEKDLNLFDFDGELLYTYTKEEALALEELPPLPQHENLTAIKWARTLDRIKDYLNRGDVVDVGVVYQTADGKSRVYATVKDESQLNNWKLRVKLKNGTLDVLVNGTTLATETESSTSLQNHEIDFNLPSAQTYPISYIIELVFSGGGQCKFGHGNTNLILDDKSDLVTRVDIGDGFGTENYAFYKFTSLESLIFNPSNPKISMTFGCQRCTSLKSIIIPNVITGSSINLYQAFDKCVSLKYAVLPENYNGSGDDIFNFTALKNIVIPHEAEGGVLNGFQNCIYLKSIIALNFQNFGTYFCENACSLKYAECGVKNIVNYTFRNTNLLQIKLVGTEAIAGNGISHATIQTYDLTDFIDPTAIPTLSNSTYINNTATILVANQEMLDAFTAETNWVAHSSQFQIKGA